MWLTCLGLLQLFPLRICIDSCVGGAFRRLFVVNAQIVALTRSFLGTSTRGLLLVVHYARTLRWILLLSRLKAVCDYTSHSALGTVLLIATLSQGELHSTFPLGPRDAWTALPTFGLLSCCQLVDFALLFACRLILRCGAESFKGS